MEEASSQNTTTFVVVFLRKMEREKSQPVQRIASNMVETERTLIPKKIVSKKT